MLTRATFKSYKYVDRSNILVSAVWDEGKDGMDTVFRFSSFLVLPFWTLMVLLPRWHWTERIIRSPLVSAAPAALYAMLVLPHLGEIWPAVARPTLNGVAPLLGSRAGATIAWVHFLTFDLLVGRWIYLDSRERQARPWLIAPLLFLTLMLGPAGFLLYLAVRSVSPAAPVAEKELIRGA